MNILLPDVVTVVQISQMSGPFYTHGWSILHKHCVIWTILMEN